MIVFVQCVCPVWLHLPDIIMFLSHGYMSGMIVFVRYVCICPIWLFFSGTIICLVWLFVLYDYLSSMIVYVLYEGICPVWMCLFILFVRYDCICPIWLFLSGTIICLVWFFVLYDYLSSMIVSVLYEGICPVWMCLFSLYFRYNWICPIWLCFFDTGICRVRLCFSGMTAFVRVYFRDAWGIYAKCNNGHFFMSRRNFYFLYAGQKQYFFVNSLCRLQNTGGCV